VTSRNVASRHPRGAVRFNCTPAFHSADPTLCRPHLPFRGTFKTRHAAKTWRNCLYRAKADSQRTDKWETHTNKCGPREPPTLVLAPLKLVSPWPLLLGNKTTSLPNSATSTFFVQSRRPSSVRSFFCSEVYKLRPSANNPWEDSLL